QQTRGLACCENEYTYPMKRFAIGFVIGVLFCVLAGVILVFAAMRFGDRKVTVADNSALVMHLEGELPEQSPVEVPLPFIQQNQPMTVLEVWQLFRKAAADPQ